MQSPHYQRSPLERYIWYKWWTYLNTLLSPKAYRSGIHSWRCALYGFGEKYHCVYPPSQYHREQSHCPKNPSCSACLFIWPSPIPGNYWFFTFLKFSSSTISYNWNQRVCGLIRFFSHNNVCIRFIHVICDLIACFFLLLNNIPLYGCTIICLSIHLQKTYWSLSVFGVSKELLNTFMCIFYIDINFQIS